MPTHEREELLNLQPSTQRGSGFCRGERRPTATETIAGPPPFGGYRHLASLGRRLRLGPVPAVQSPDEVVEGRPLVAVLERRHLPVMQDAQGVVDPGDVGISGRPTRRYRALPLKALPDQ